MSPVGKAARQLRLPGRSTWPRWSGAGEVLLLVVGAALPFLLSSPGWVSADSRQYLYLDPGRFLARAAQTWDPTIGAGTVPHQHIGFLVPMGPFFWMADASGLPMWFAQRLWWATITVAAALGARWLLRSLGAGRVGALAGAVVYAASPYQLAFTARISVLLLPWAALPWLVGLAVRATRRGGWRDPALFALVVLLTGGANASTLIFALLAPAVWWVVGPREPGASRWASIAAGGRAALLTLGVSLWWLAALRVQGAHGMPVLHVTERLETIATASRPDDVLRGLGNWFFYGRDRFGHSIDQASHYLESRPLRAVTHGLPVVALLAAAFTRWRYRTYALVLVIVGVVVSAGAWPPRSPSPYGSAWQAFSEGTSVGFALRNTPRAVPLVVLGLAMALAAGVGAVRAGPRRVAAGGVVAGLALAGMWPVLREGVSSSGLERPEEIPAYWVAAAEALDARGGTTRVWEVPGINFATYRWGNTVEPVTPGLMDRPFLAREILPFGSAESALLLDAVDRRMQEGTFEASSLAPVARLFGVGDVVLRSDLQFERFRTPRPRVLWDALVAPPAPGLGEPEGFGAPVPNVPDPRFPMLDALELRSTGLDHPPPVARFEVLDPSPIVRIAPRHGPVLLDGDAEGIVDAAAAGLVDGRSLVLLAGALSDEQVGDALADGAHVILTDSNRRRIQTWFYTLRDSRGRTERAGETAHDPTSYDFRLDPYSATGDGDRTVVEQVGGRVHATADAGPERPEDRAVAAVDGDPMTAWRVGGADPTGSRLVIEPADPLEVDHVVLLQPQEGPRDRVLERVRLSVTDPTGAVQTLDVVLDERSLDPPGQAVDLTPGAVGRLEVELLATTAPPFDPALANAVGFAEVAVGGLDVVETVRLPSRLVGVAGDRLARHAVDVVLSRLRYEPAERGRTPQEPVLDRSVALPGARSFEVSGTARVNPGAPGPVIDELLGTTAPGVTFDASSHLLGDADARASRAFDGLVGTAWTADVGPQAGQWLEAELADAVELGGEIGLAVVADGRHSVPTRVAIELDGDTVDVVDLPAVPDGAVEGHVERFALPVDSVEARTVRIVVAEARAGSSLPATDPGAASLPVAVAELTVPGLPRPEDPGAVPSPCRADLLEVAGEAVAVRIEGPVAEGRAGLAVRSCDGPLDLPAGTTRLRATAGDVTGVDLDRLVLSSGPGGGPADPGRRGAPGSEAGATVTVARDGPSAIDLALETDGDPFWLVLGQSRSDGWSIEVDGASVGPSTLVDGYANGWLVEPDGPGALSARLRWRPQATVDLALVASGLVALGCLVIVGHGWWANRASSTPPVRRTAEVDRDTPEASLPWRHRPPALRRPLAGRVVLIGAACAWVWGGPVVALGAGALALAWSLLPATRWAILLLPAASVAIAPIVDEPRLVWLGLAAVAIDLAGTRRAELAAGPHR